MRALLEDRVPPLQKIGLIYAAWLVICGLAAWFLARWSAQRRLNDVLFVVLGVIAVINLAQLAYALGFSVSLLTRPRNGLEKFLQHTDIVWYVLFALWPFLAAIGVAQASLRISGRAPLARWSAFGCGIVIAALTPVFLIFTTCRFAGMCV